ncbi:MAG: hypothetical protein QGH45_14075, partial [Myxococcota bacterium]|nr:hypothetical protein [Myxococcota bacterium]
EASCRPWRYHWYRIAEQANDPVQTPFSAGAEPSVRRQPDYNMLGGKKMSTQDVVVSGNFCMCLE